MPTKSPVIGLLELQPSHIFIVLSYIWEKWYVINEKWHYMIQDYARKENT